MKKIALCGFMGCGKTTVANELSQSFNLKHIDTDKYIEEKANRSITEIFSSDGEAFFRQLEHETICQLSQNSDCVLSLGGGAVMFENNLNVLKQNGYQIVFINTDFDVIKKRLSYDNTRPLLKSNDIKALYDVRLEKYKNACDIEIICTDHSAHDIAKMIIDKTK